MDRGQDEFLLLGGREDLIQVDRDTKGDQEEAADAGSDPIGWLKWWGRNKLRPEGGASLSDEYRVVAWSWLDG